MDPRLSRKEKTNECGDVMGMSIFSEKVSSERSTCPECGNKEARAREDYVLYGERCIRVVKFECPDCRNDWKEHSWAHGTLDDMYCGICGMTRRHLYRWKDDISDVRGTLYVLWSRCLTCGGEDNTCFRKPGEETWRDKG